MYKIKYLSTLKKYFSPNKKIYSQYFILCLDTREEQNIKIKKFSQSKKFVLKNIEAAKRN